MVVLLLWIFRFPTQQACPGGDLACESFEARDFFSAPPRRSLFVVVVEFLLFMILDLRNRWA